LKDDGDAALGPEGEDEDAVAKGVKPKALPRPAAGGDGRVKTSKKTVKISKELQPLLKWLTMATLSALQTGRDFQGIVLDCVTMQTDTPLCQALLNTGKRYAAACAEAGKGHGYGPPHLHLMAALLKHLLSCDVGSVNRRHLQGFYDYNAALDMWEQNLTIRQCRVVKMYDSGAKKLFIAINEVHLVEVQQEHGFRSIRKTLMDALTQLDCKVMMGSPPAGHMERELASYLTAIAGSA